MAKGSGYDVGVRSQHGTHMSRVVILTVINPVVHVIQPIFEPNVPTPITHDHDYYIITKDGKCVVGCCK